MVMNVGNVMSAYQKAAGSGADIGSLAKAGPTSGVGSFSDVLENFVGDAVESVKRGEEMAAKGAVGKADIQDVILAVNEAEVMMHAFTTIRDRVITAYQEVIRTAI